MTLTKSKKKQSRNIPVPTRIKLGIVSGGHCEFRGCNDYLFYHPITLQDGNFSEHAHIYPFSDNATRGEEIESMPDDIHDVLNLMLICPTCHELVDDKKNKYTVADLKEMKAEHEERIHYVTSFNQDDKTLALIIKGFVVDRPVDVTFNQIHKAVAPMYPSDRKGYTLDLTQFGHDLTEDYFDQAQTYIIRRLKQLYERDIDGSAPNHISVFGVASIPLLILIGRHISDKIPVDFYHRHRNTPDPWKWQTGGTPLSLDVRQLQAGKDTKHVGIIVSMSGQVQRKDLPDDINEEAALYEIFLPDQTPDVRALRTRDDLQHFWQTYAALLAKVAITHPECSELYLFLAAPPPVAMVCGHERLPKVQPTLCLYDNIFNQQSEQRKFILRLKTR